jgi:hypothetical protein
MQLVLFNEHTAVFSYFSRNLTWDIIGWLFAWSMTWALAATFASYKALKSRPFRT